MNPRTHYAYGTGPTLFEDLREAFERLTDVTTAAEALIEAETYRTKSLSFSGPLAARMACDGRTHPGTKSFTYLSEPHITILTFLSLISLYLLAAQWWSMFGSSTPTLSMLARRLVSQCASSSGCERNWSTFAFIHTKVRNRLSYKKLHKLVYVNYNLRIQNNLDAGIRSTLDDDPFQRLMELTLNEDNNPLRDWMETGRSNAAPELDEEDTDSDVPLPTHLVTDTVNTPDLQQWAATTVGDTHTGKRKKQMTQRKKSKRTKGKGKRQVQSDESTNSDPKSPTYQESNDSSSKTDSGDDDGQGGDAHPGQTSVVPPVQFTGESQFSHATQDQDHGAPSSPRHITHGGHDGPQDSASYSSSYGMESSSGSYPYHYPAPNAHSEPPIHWVYEWQDPEFYATLQGQWSTTSAWTGQTWAEFKAELLSTRRLMLMSTNEYTMAECNRPPS